MIGHVNLVRELKSLRKGRGVLASGIEDRVGPALRAACEIVSGDDKLAIRRKVTARLTELARRLPDDLAEVALVAFALKAEARHALYQDRVSWVANEDNCDTRTIRRRVDEAIDHLAELAEATPVSGSRAVRTSTELHVVLSLDRSRPELLELHRTTAVEDDLVELDFTTTCQIQEPRVLYGGTLIAPDRLRLPAPLSRGTSHAFAIHGQLATAPSALILVPEHSYTVLDLRVRFAQSATPREVWAIRGLSRDGSGAFSTTPLRIDDAGEIHLRQTDLAAASPRGVQWSH
ncbi:hypothetical protein JOD54_006175 [Actinokineospora baliensis]|uniref:hypothetical protein n=1 Tax=Actinokineospora baliensis TaxID=547056 RepID=UPI00195B825F|nr:hypothetical protein [Actinokineospora baliensis]MBM7775971.1 hypothetical protein [Actinokineospora baliensis]